MRWLAHLDIWANYDGAPNPDEHRALLLREFLAAVERLESVRSARRGRTVAAAMLGQTPEYTILVEFEHFGDEEAASGYASTSIYHPAFDAAVDAVGDRRPDSCGAHVQVEALADRRPGKRPRSFPAHRPRFRVEAKSSVAVGGVRGNGLPGTPLRRFVQSPLREALCGPSARRQYTSLAPSASEPGTMSGATSRVRGWTGIRKRPKWTSRF